MIEVGVAHRAKGGYEADPAHKVYSIVVDFLTPRPKPRCGASGAWRATSTPATRHSPPPSARPGQDLRRGPRDARGATAQPTRASRTPPAQAQSSTPAACARHHRPAGRRRGAAPRWRRPPEHAGCQARRRNPASRRGVAIGLPTSRRAIAPQAAIRWRAHSTMQGSMRCRGPPPRWRASPVPVSSVCRHRHVGHVLAARDEVAAPPALADVAGEGFPLRSAWAGVMLTTAASPEARISAGLRLRGALPVALECSGLNSPGFAE